MPAVLFSIAFVLLVHAAQDTGDARMHSAALSPDERFALIVEEAESEIAKGSVRAEVESWFAL